jgi:hypothetical protein
MCILLGEPCPIIFQGVTAPEFSIFFEKYFVFATPPKPFGVFLETWYRERSHCVDVHIVRGALSILFFKELRLMDLAFSLKNTVLATPPKPFRGF